MLWCYIQKVIIIPKAKYLEFLLCYLLKVLQFSIFHLGLLSILSWSFFVKGIKSVSRFIFFVCGYLVGLALFVEKTVFYALYCYCSFIEDQLTVFVGVYFWALCFVPLIYLSVLSPTLLHCLDHCRLVVSFKIRNPLILFFNIFFNIL